MKQVSQAQIKRWKSQYGDVYAIEVKLDDKGKQKAVGYFRKPDLNIIAAASRFADTDPIKSGEVLLENCWLDGDDVIKTDDEAKMGVLTQLGKLFKIKEAEVKKL